MYYRLCWAQTLNQTAKMSQRLDNAKMLWCLLALHAGSFWGTARSVNVRAPPSNPSTIEAQAKFFQDFFSVQLSPYKIEFGHVCEDPNTWEQRYEKKDFENHRDMGKVRWGDKKGGYGEHYWDLNHAGNADNHGDDGDDGSYHESDNSDAYDEPSNNAPTYGTEEYDPEKASYEESGRAKRAHPKVDRESKQDRKQHKNKSRNTKEQLESAETSQEEEYEDHEDESYEQPKQRRQQYRKKDDNHKEKEKNQVVLVVSHKDDADQQQNQYTPTNQAELSQYLTEKQTDSPQYLQQNQPSFGQYLPQNQGQLPPHVPKQHLEPPHYVPYEGGAGVRQHQQPQVSAATTVPRLFLEPSTGHVVDRATGQAYVLQPIASHNNYN